MGQTMGGGFWKKAWKWIAGGLTALVAVAGFASPEFRGLTCLDLPKSDDLIYLMEPAESTDFVRISTQSQQASFDGHKLVFRARYYGETHSDAFTPYLRPELTKGYAYLNLRPLNFVSQDTPLGSTATSLPGVLVLLQGDKASQLANLENGAVVQVRGTGVALDRAEDGSRNNLHYLELAPIAQEPPLPEFIDFYVVADEALALKPINAPESRFLCRMFHDVGSDS
jgi:hypothetical protein